MKIMLALGAALVCCDSVFSQESLERIAISGVVMPGTGGAISDSVGSGTINGQGDVVLAFGLVRDEVNVTAANDVIRYLLSDGSFDVLFREGDAAPGLSGLTIGNGNVLGPSESGVVLYSTGLAGPGVEFNTDSVLYEKRDGVATLLLREGDDAPFVPGIPINQINDPIVAPNGDVSFAIDLLTVNGVDSSNNRAMYIERAGVRTLYARTDDPSPGVPNGLYSAIGAPIFRGDGSFVFDANLRPNQGLPLPFDETVYTVQGVTPTLEVFQGNPLVIAPTLTVDSFFSLGYTPSGAIPFRGVLANFPLQVGSDNNEFLGRYSDGQGEIVMREGFPGPGPFAGVFESFLAYRANAAGDIVAYASVDEPQPQIDTRGFYRSTDSTAELVVREGDPIPGMPGFVFLGFEDDVFMNAMGDFIFRADVGMPGDSPFSSPSGLFLYDAVLEQSRLIVLTQSTIDSDPDPSITDLRTVIGWTANFGGKRPVTSGLGDARQLVYTVNFQDGLRAVYLLSLNNPETGRCCLPDGLSPVVTAQQCAKIGGMYAGDGVFIDTYPCGGGTACAADFDGDFDVDLGDFGLFGAAFGSMAGDAGYFSGADFDMDGDVDLGDFGIFGAQFGNGAGECAAG